MPTNEMTAADGTPILMIFIIVLLESVLDVAYNRFLFRISEIAIRNKTLVILFFHPNHSGKCCML